MTTSVQSILNHPLVLKVDADDSIDLYCYDSRRIESEGDELARSCRGMAVDRRTQTVVYPGQAYVQTLDVDKVTDELIRTHGPCTRMIEGTMIRCFHANNKWYITTSKRLNAFRSKWGGYYVESFGDLFSKALEYAYSTDDSFRTKLESCPPSPTHSVLSKFLHTLNTAESHSFLVTNITANRRVCAVSSIPRVYHINRTPTDLGLPRPTRLSFSTAKELRAYLETLDPMRSPGVRIGNYAVFAPDYARLQELRGNQPVLGVRYLELKHGDESDALLEFRRIYTRADDNWTDHLDELYRVLVQKAVDIYYLRYVAPCMMYIHTISDLHQILSRVRKAKLKNWRAEIDNQLQALPKSTLYRLIHLYSQTDNYWVNVGI